MRTHFTLHGVRMHVAETDPQGVVNADTYFSFSQWRDVVTATYKGGGIRQGYLVGLLQGAVLQFHYCQVGVDGELDSGISQGALERMPDGRLRMIEHFEWASRSGTGVNVFEEVDPHSRK